MATAITPFKPCMVFSPLVLTAIAVFACTCVARTDQDRIGAEGPFSSLIQVGEVPLVHAGDDARFGLLAGTTVGPAALLRFYVLHCVLIPAVMTVFLAVHFWRIRKDGGISGPL